MRNSPTLKQRKFALAYVAFGGCAADAYRAAYATAGMAPQTVRREASRLLVNPHVQPLIEQPLIEQAATRHLEEFRAQLRAGPG